MEELLLILALAIMFIAGFFVMKSLDRFFERNKRETRTEDSSTHENEPASCVMLTGDLSDKEIAEELRRFRRSHENTRIMLYEEAESFTDKNFDEVPHNGGNC